VGDRRRRVQLVILWRISNHADLSGLGGERSDGRWHTSARGKRIVYLSEHPAVALVESVANLRGNPALFPERFQLLKVAAPDDSRVMEVDTEMAAAEFTETQAAGNAWLAGRKSALLRVPLVPSPESWSYLLNPLHSDAREVAVEWARSIAYDKRLFRIRGM
jgi:RES domain-containing protein